MDRRGVMIDKRLFIVTVAAVAAAKHLIDDLTDGVTAVPIAVARIILRGCGGRTHERGSCNAARQKLRDRRHATLLDTRRRETHSGSMMLPIVTALHRC